MQLVEVSRDRVSESADVLARAMLDEPVGRYLFPDPDEFLAFHRRAHTTTMERAIDEGHVDAWGDPVVGVAVWLIRTAIDEPQPARSSTSDPTQLSADAAARIRTFTAVMRQLRERARPDRHVYLDSLGVLPKQRRLGIGSRLLEAGHEWADSVGLPCALDTFDDRHVGFYRRHGYRVVAAESLPGSGLTGTAMRREARHRPDTRQTLAVT